MQIELMATQSLLTAWRKDPAITTMKTATMAKKTTRVRSRALPEVRPFLSNQWRSDPKITERKIANAIGPTIDDAAFIPASTMTAAARGIRIRDTSDVGVDEFMEKGSPVDG